jgi:magnesium transporter
MLRMVNHMVDSYLDLRRELTRQLEHWQAELLAQRALQQLAGRCSMTARMPLHVLEDLCEDQRTPCRSGWTR